MLIKVGWHIKSCSDSATPLLNYVKIYDKVGIYQHLKRRKTPKKNDEYNEKRKDLPRLSRYYQGQIDLAYLEKGSGYDELKDSIIIFICRFDPFGHGFSRYTVKSVIEGHPDIPYNDGACKVFLSTLPDQKGEISDELRHFLDYVNGSAPRGMFAQKLDEAVIHARSMESWRKEYMLLEEMIEEGREEGRQEGREDERDSIMLLTQRMEDSGRTEELLAALKDRALLLKLYKEFHIQETDQ